jgi:hypothetical protein
VAAPEAAFTRIFPVLAMVPAEIVPVVFMEALPAMVPEIIAEPDTLPALVTVASLLSAIAALLLISASKMDPSVMWTEVTLLAVAREPRPRLVRAVDALLKSERFRLGFRAVTPAKSVPLALPERALLSPDTWEISI